MEPLVVKGHIVNEFGNITDEMVQSNDNDAAVDYALRRNKSTKKENHTVKEILFSASRLPTDLKGKPMTFLVLYVNLHSLDEHDKKTIGKLSDDEIHDFNDEDRSEESAEEETKADRDVLASVYAKKKKVELKVVRREFKKFLTDERKVEWEKCMTSELVVNDVSPIYLSGFSFNSANFPQIEFKIEIYASHRGAIATDSGSAKLLGEAEFKVEDLHKVRLQTAAVSYQLRNTTSNSNDRNLLRSNSQVMLRYDVVEQTSTVVQLQFMVKAFDCRKIQFRLSRTRTLGEYYPVYVSSVIINDRV